MRRRFILTLALMALGAIASAQSYITFETVTVAGSAVGLSASTIDPSGYPQMQRCIGRLETAEIRYRTDGTAATASVGVALEPLEILTIVGHVELAQLSMIRTGGTSGTMTFQCYQK